MEQDNNFTVGHLIELLQQYPKDAIFSVEDMDGNAFYSNCIADHLDCDSPSVELIIPIYVHTISIEPDEEENVFINQSRVHVLRGDE